MYSLCNFRLVLCHTPKLNKIYILAGPPLTDVFIDIYFLSLNCMVTL